MCFKALLGRDEFRTFKQNSQIKSITSTSSRYLFFTHNLAFTHNLNVSSKILQCVIVSRTFQLYFLCSCCIITFLVFPSLKEILLFLHGLALVISFLYILLNQHEKVALWVLIAYGFECSYLLPLFCHIRCSAKLESSADSLLKVPAKCTQQMPNMYL